MRVVVSADDGDQIEIEADDVAAEQAVIRLGLQNTTYDESSEFEGVTLTVRRARELAGALLTIAEAIESYHTHCHVNGARGESAFGCGRNAPISLSS